MADLEARLRAISRQVPARFRQDIDTAAVDAALLENIATEVGSLSPILGGEGVIRNARRAGYGRVSLSERLLEHVRTAPAGPLRDDLQEAVTAIREWELQRRLRRGGDRGGANPPLGGVAKV